MNKRLDTLIIADKGGYENVAFVLDYTSLKLNGEIMTIQNLKKRFFSKNNLPLELIESDCLNYEMTGKLNGIYLYDYCTKNELNCALVDGIWPNEEEFIRLLEKGPRTITLSTTWLLNVDQVKEVTSFIRGLDKKIAARFSFILSVPTIFAAAVYKSASGIEKIHIDVVPLILFFLVAFLSGYFALIILYKMIMIVLDLKIREQ